MRFVPTKRETDEQLRSVYHQKAPNIYTRVFHLCRFEIYHVQLPWQRALSQSYPLVLDSRPYW